MHYGTQLPDISNKLCMYFLRARPGTFSVPGTADEANDVLSYFFDYGILNSHPLFMLTQMLTKVSNYKYVSHFEQ